MDLERRLREELRPEVDLYTPSHDFAGRISARIERRQRHRRVATAGAMVLVLVAGIGIPLAIKSVHHDSNTAAAATSTGVGPSTAGSVPRTVITLATAAPTTVGAVTAVPIAAVPTTAGAVTAVPTTEVVPILPAKLPSRFVTTDSDGTTVTRFTTANLQYLDDLPTGDSAARFSPSGGLAVVASTESTSDRCPAPVQAIVDLRTKNRVSSVLSKPISVTLAAVADDGSLAAFLPDASNNCLSFGTLWIAPPGGTLRSLKDFGSRKSEFIDLAWSTGNDHVMVEPTTDQILVYDINSTDPVPIRLVPAGHSSVGRCALGSIQMVGMTAYATNQCDSTTEVFSWDLASARPGDTVNSPKKVGSFDGPMQSLSVSPDGHSLIFIGGGGTVQIAWFTTDSWDMRVTAVTSRQVHWAL